MCQSTEPTDSLYYLWLWLCSSQYISHKVLWSFPQELGPCVENVEVPLHFSHHSYTDQWETVLLAHRWCLHSGLRWWIINIAQNVKGNVRLTLACFLHVFVEHKERQHFHDSKNRPPPSDSTNWKTLCHLSCSVNSLLSAMIILTKTIVWMNTLSNITNALSIWLIS